MNFTVIAVDQRGIGLSDKPESGYDDGTQANDMVALMDALGHKRFSMIGFDTGMPIGYALAVDHPERLDRLVVGEALSLGRHRRQSLSSFPGRSTSGSGTSPSTGSDPKSTRRSSGGAKTSSSAPSTPLLRGRRCPTRSSSTTSTASLPAPDALRGSFGFYRAIDTSSAQNQQRKTKRLTLPVLVIGGATGIGEGAANTMKLVADDVRSVVIPGSGHWVAEEAPDEVLAALTQFLAPYRLAAR